MSSLYIIPDRVIKAVDTGPLPIFVYDTLQIQERVALAQSLLDGYYYPIKACPEKEVLSAALKEGAGLDLCSEGDFQLAATTDCPGERLSFTSVHITPSLLQSLIKVQAVFNADSVIQAKEWKKMGGYACGLRIASTDTSSVYGIKFGIRASEIGNAVQELKDFGVSVIGLHIHESHANRTAENMMKHLLDTLIQVDCGVLKHFNYINLGGGWPLLNGVPTSSDSIEVALNLLRRTLERLGFKGSLYCEPGEWVVGPAGYWAARVSAVKRHPIIDEKRIIVLDTPTPVPCRPSENFHIHHVADSFEADNQDKRLCDLFGSANTGTDTIGINVLLGDVKPGDTIIAVGQGAYVRSLIGSFNERPLPRVAIV
ncbi:MAG: hypothetical protein AB2L22_12925 [Syntrophales bacterium]